MKAMITPQNNDGIVAEFQSIQLGNHSANLGINVGSRGIVAMDELTSESIIDLAFV